MGKPCKILIVEDESITAFSIGEDLKGRGYGITGMVGSAAEAIDNVSRENPDYILMDINIKGDINGIVAAEKIAAISKAKIIFLTGYAIPDIGSMTKNINVSGCLEKPIMTDDIVDIIENT